MPIVSFRVRDVSILDLFDRYCAEAGLSKGEAFERMVREHCGPYSEPDQCENLERTHDLKKRFVDRLSDCFEKDGGTLVKFNKYFLLNAKYLVYPFYRRLGEKESKMVTVDGTQIDRLLRLAEKEGRIPLLAVFIAGLQEQPVLGLMRIEHIPRIQPEPGMRYSWAHVFLREDNHSVYIHARIQKDFDAIREITRASMSEAMLKLVFSNEEDLPWRK